MSDLGAIVAQAQSLSSSDDGLSQLQSVLDGASDLLATEHANALVTLSAGTLDPRAHSLAWVHVLSAACGVHKKDAAPPHKDPNAPEALTFFALATALLKTCDAAQVRRDPKRFAVVCGEVRDLAMALGKPLAAVAPLAAAVRAAQPNPDHLTPQHAMLFQCALLGKCPNAALAVLSRRVFEVVPSATALTTKDFLLYCYYGGMCFAALRRYEDAADLLLHAITAPASAVSAIVVEAYKKYICTSLIGAGSVPPFPRCTSPMVQRQLKSSCPEYIAIAEAYATRNGEKLRKAAVTHNERFAKDGNAGLVDLVLKSLAKRNVQRLTLTYLTLSLEDIASAVALPGGASEAETQIVGMIEAGEIFASVSQKDGMVSFHDVSADLYSGAKMAKRLDSEIREVMELSNRVRVLDDALRANKAYLTKVSEIGSEFGGLRGMKVGGDEMDFSGDP